VILEAMRGPAGPLLPRECAFGRVDDDRAVGGTDGHRLRVADMLLGGVFVIDGDSFNARYVR